jgi:hypothetical protein
MALVRLEPCGSPNPHPHAPPLLVVNLRYCDVFVVEQILDPPNRHA